MANDTLLYFGIKVQGTAPNIRIYDNSTTSNIDLTIPAGVYYFDHSETAKSLVKTINSLITSYGSLTVLSNSKQLEFSFTDINDEFYILSGGDSRILCDMLGSYESSVDLEYLDEWQDGQVTQQTKTIFDCSAGYIYEAYNSFGFPEWDSIYFQSKDGAVTDVSTAVINYFKLTLQLVAGSLLNANLADLEYQSTFQSSVLTDPKCLFWTCYDSLYRTPQIYANFDNLDDNEYYISKKIKPDDVVMSNTILNDFYDINLQLSLKVDAT